MHETHDIAQASFSNISSSLLSPTLPANMFSGGPSRFSVDSSDLYLPDGDPSISAHCNDHFLHSHGSAFSSRTGTRTGTPSASALFSGPLASGSSSTIKSDSLSPSAPRSPNELRLQGLSQMGTPGFGYSSTLGSPLDLHNTQGQARLIIEQATHEDLMAKNAAYTQLWEVYSEMKTRNNVLQEAFDKLVDAVRAGSRGGATTTKDEYATSEALGSKLTQAKYPKVKFWFENAWKEYLDANSEKSSQRDIPRGSVRLAESDENVRMTFIENADGQPMGGGYASDARHHARRIWNGWLTRTGAPPLTWGQIDADYAAEFEKKMYAKFPLLALCENDWKVMRIGTMEYSSWSSNHFKNSDKNGQSSKAVPSKRKATRKPTDAEIIKRARETEDYRWRSVTEAREAEAQAAEKQSVTPTVPIEVESSVDCTRSMKEAEATRGTEGDTSTTPPDTTPLLDATLPIDATALLDTTPLLDATPPIDATALPDVTTPPDATTPIDATTPPEATALPDASTMLDATTTMLPDASTSKPVLTGSLALPSPRASASNMVGADLSQDPEATVKRAEEARPAVTQLSNPLDAVKRRLPIQKKAPRISAPALNAPSNPRLTIPDMQTTAVTAPSQASLDQQQVLPAATQKPPKAKGAPLRITPSLSARNLYAIECKKCDPAIRADAFESLWEAVQLDAEDKKKWELATVKAKEDKKASKKSSTSGGGGV